MMQVKCIDSLVFGALRLRNIFGGSKVAKQEGAIRKFEDALACNVTLSRGKKSIVARIPLEAVVLCIESRMSLIDAH